MTLQNHVHKEKNQHPKIPFIEHAHVCLIKLTPGTFQLQKPLLTTSSQKMI